MYHLLSMPMYVSLLSLLSCKLMKLCETTVDRTTLHTGCVYLARRNIWSLIMISFSFTLFIYGHTDPGKWKSDTRRPFFNILCKDKDCFDGSAGVTDVSMSHLSTIHLKVLIKVGITQSLNSAQWLFQEVHGMLCAYRALAPHHACSVTWFGHSCSDSMTSASAEFFLNTSCCTPLIFFYISFPPTETLTKADRCRRYRALLNLFLGSAFFVFFFSVLHITHDSTGSVAMAFLLVLGCN